MYHAAMPSLISTERVGGTVPPLGPMNYTRSSVSRTSPCGGSCMCTSRRTSLRSTLLSDAAKSRMTARKPDRVASENCRRRDASSAEKADRRSS